MDRPVDGHSQDQADVERLKRLTHDPERRADGIIEASGGSTLPGSAALRSLLAYGVS